MAEVPLLLKQVVAVIDERTTIICLSAAGQIQPVEEPFDTLNGLFDHPPFHISCRDVVAPWMDGFVNDVRRAANLELRRRPAKERRKADERYRGRVGPPPVDENRPVDAAGQLISRPGGPLDQQPSTPPPPGLLDQLAAELAAEPTYTITGGTEAERERVAQLMRLVVDGVPELLVEQFKKVSLAATASGAAVLSRGPAEPGEPVAVQRLAAHPCLQSAPAVLPWLRPVDRSGSEASGGAIIWS